MKIKPFRGLRPVAEHAADIACKPYDVLSSEEAAEAANGNPWSFLRVVKPEITTPGINPYDERVYEAGRENFRRMLDEGTFLQDEQDCLYIYQLEMAGHIQTGIVACAWVEDYLAGRIKKHELTRPDKEADRKRHIRVSMLNAEPVFFAYKYHQGLDKLVVSQLQGKPEYDFTSDDGVIHRLWVVREVAVIREIVSLFSGIPCTYVADGHHRTAAAALVGNDLKDSNPGHTGAEEYNYFLAVHFPDNQLQILDYNRLVRDLNGLTLEAFLQAIAVAFEVEDMGTHPHRPAALHEMGMFIGGRWYRLVARPGTFDDNDPVGVLDVTILSNQILAPLLGITDLRSDKRIEFVGGIRGMSELQRRVESGEMAVAFALYPVTMQQLIDIADSGNIMPPKTTWFEPKLRSGLVVHSLT